MTTGLRAPTQAFLLPKLGSWIRLCHEIEMQQAEKFLDGQEEQRSTDIIAEKRVRKLRAGVPRDVW
jgi:hypothetical protein